MQTITPLNRLPGKIARITDVKLRKCNWEHESGSCFRRGFRGLPILCFSGAHFKTNTAVTEKLYLITHSKILTAHLVTLLSANIIKQALPRYDADIEIRVEFLGLREGALWALAYRNVKD